MKPLLAFMLLLSPMLLVGTDKTSEELDIRESTFRYQFQKDDRLHNAKVHCLEIVLKGKSIDPDDAFMQRFDGDLPAVKKASGCSRESIGVKDKATGVHGLIFRNEGIQWVSDTEVEVDGGFFEAGNSGARDTYYLQKIDRKWTVRKAVRHAMA